MGSLPVLLVIEMSFRKSYTASQIIAQALQGFLAWLPQSLALVLSYVVCFFLAAPRPLLNDCLPSALTSCASCQLQQPSCSLAMCIWQSLTRTYRGFPLMSLCVNDGQLLSGGTPSSAGVSQTVGNLTCKFAGVLDENTGSGWMESGRDLSSARG